MKTTQKRGIGRALDVGGEGAAAFPPSPLGPVTVYRQPEVALPTGRSLVARVLGWVAIVLAMCIAGVAGGAYLYLHESVAAVAVESEDVKKAVQKLDIVLPGAAANALVIGYDQRADEAEGTPSRSDTLMLVRTDPGPEDDLAAVLPTRHARRDPSARQGHVDGQDQRRLRAMRLERDARDPAQADRPAMNYLMTVNFRGFRQLVDSLGGVWMDVDRRYYNDQAGLSGYATINLQPGYQKLTGHRALDFVRFRHTDSDLFRNARQQQFVRAFKDQIDAQLLGPRRSRGSSRRSPSNVEVAQGGGKNVACEDGPVLRRCSRTRSRQATSSRRGSTVSRVSSDLTTAPRTCNARCAVHEPRCRLAEEGRRPWRSARR